MRGWQVVRVGKRKLRSDDHRAEVVVVLRSDMAAGVLRAGDRMRTVSRDANRGSPLTPRQLQVLQLLAAGKTYAEIALAGGVTVSTVRTHIHLAYRRLGVVDRAQAVLKAVEEGWM
jgi:DNA-binding CsgD family transcriptional regulator